MKYIKLLRVKHYIKNILVFSSLVFSGELFQKNKTIYMIIGFFLFSLVSSVVYIINDIKDVNKDRNHPKKKNRPIAAGNISIKTAKLIAIFIFMFSFILNYVLFGYQSTLILFIYILINLLYSFGLKNIPIVDVTILTIGFVIRVIYGALIANIRISNWLYLTVLSIAFYFSLGKRRNELKQINNYNTRTVLKLYPMEFLNKSMIMFLTLSNTFYALWAIEASSRISELLIYTVPLVLIITLKYSFDIEGDSDGDPVEVLLNDKILIIMSIIYALFMLIVLYIIK